MGNIIFRMAKPGDAKALANLHWNVRERYSKEIGRASCRERV